MGVQGQAELVGYSRGRLPGTLLPTVFLNLGLGVYRKPEVREPATPVHEEDLPAPLLLNLQSQSGLLLPRPAGNEVGWQAGAARISKIDR